MELLENPVRLRFDRREHNAANRALLRLVRDHGLRAESGAGALAERWWVERGDGDCALHIIRNETIDTALSIVAVDARGSEFLELLFQSLLREWSRPESGPTYRRNITRPEHIEAVLRILR